MQFQNKKVARVSIASRHKWFWIIFFLFLVNGFNGISWVLIGSIWNCRLGCGNHLVWTIVRKSVKLFLITFAYCATFCLCYGTCIILYMRKHWAMRGMLPPAPIYWPGDLNAGDDFSHSHPPQAPILFPLYGFSNLPGRSHKRSWIPCDLKAQ